MHYDRRSYALGMVTAFCECVAGGCKRLALSPPLSAQDMAAFGDEARALIEAHGLLWYHERNEDLPKEGRFEWLLIASRHGTIDAYLALRRRGLSPAASLEPFAELLSYDPSQGVDVHYDAWRTQVLPNS